MKKVLTGTNLALVCPIFFFCMQLGLVVYEQGQRTMKTAIKMIWPLCRFRIEDKKLGPFLTKKYIKNQSYQNMSMIKVGLLFHILQ